MNFQRTYTLGKCLFFSGGMELFGCMDFLKLILQVFVGLGILNVWLLRANSSTGYRGGDAKNLKEEFATYGLPTWVFYLVGTLKITFALALIAGVWIPVLTLSAALGMAVLMAGAFVMHLKVKDSFSKAWPSLTLLAICLAIAAL